MLAVSGEKIPFGQSAFPPLPVKLPSGQSAVALDLPASDPVAGNCFLHPVLVSLVAPNNQQLACLWYEAGCLAPFHRGHWYGGTWFCDVCDMNHHMVVCYDEILIHNPVNKLLI